ncbi:antiviral reverse transcriptase Drt3a [Vibrio sp. 1733]|uniref:antiviral reverse transcriptase Drt3a n=1 Tax=Vibrio TaxID=662 RepID=UPI00111FEE11|nr:MULTISPECIES: antiviral reverse transcriptase Drt3a [Vibrio]EJG1746508.1 RNA-directed DNA polymerase [Vibrio parahaemolyticus]MDW2186764.1 antiviral reverse transcriptase Drt3a [Vibrio sp. 1733]MDW2236647.1 antiviral reverse transcriptase Drt3a [Vibrio sp. 1565-1]TOJ11645.1 reverse transcriptase [Vibrio parahaemolyticus]
MFDQSFSVKNFRKIYDIDRKNKGTIEIEYFPEAYKIRIKINLLRKLVKRLEKKKKSGLVTNLKYQERKNKFNSLIEIRNEQYNEVIENKLKEVVKIVSAKGYSLPLEKLPNKVRGKDVFTIGNKIESIFVSKQIQYTLNSLFDVRINHRDIIISRLSTLSKDMSPKFIIRADVENFYESINHKKLLDILHSSPKLSVTPRRVITQLVRNFSRIVGSDIGLPRGVGLSAYLSEVYMNSVDSEIRALQDITYYQRYVDDLIIIFSPSKAENTSKYLTKIHSIINKKELALNNKTKELDLYNNDNASFEYLGYKFNIATGSCKIKLSNSKSKKIRNRINKTFDEYHNSFKKTPRRAYRNILLRLRFLTGNTRLYNSKSKAFVGIYFSNKFINDTSDLNGLDNFLTHKINGLQDQKLKNRISNLSFEKGFKDRIFRKFSIQDLSNISKVWKNG